MRTAVVVVGLLIFACDKDPCGNVTDGFTIHGIRGPAGVQLDWTAVPADDYEIWAVDVSGNPVATVKTKSVALTWSVDLGDVTFEVHPSIRRRVCPAAGSIVVPPAPVLAAEPVDAGMQLSWTADPLLGGAIVLGRNLDGGSNFDVIATPEGTSYLDEDVTDGTHYTYLLQMHGPNLEAYSAIHTETLQPAPRVTATEYVDGIGLTITPTGDSSTWTVTLVSPPGLPTETLDWPLHPPEWKCPPDTDCTYSVQCGYPPGRPAFVTSRRAPPAPTNCLAAPAVNGVRLQWTPPGPSVTSAIFRETPSGEVALGAVTGAAYFDAAAELFGSATYKIASLASDGTFDPRSTCTTQPAFAVTAPDAMNLAPQTGTVGSDQLPGQIFAVGTGGQLMGIELPSAEADSVCVYDTSDPQGSSQLGCTHKAPLDLGGPNLSAGDVLGAYFDLSALQLLVSAGQTLRFQLGSAESRLIAYSGDVVSGSATLVDYTADPARDLLFKTFVLPSAALEAPVVTARSGVGGALLTWTASPGATGYDVLDANGAVVVHTLETHAVAPLAPSQSASFTVRATSATSAASSQAVTAQALALIADAENLCGAYATTQYVRESSTTSWQLVQTVVVQHSGTLAALELGMAQTTRYYDAFASVVIQDAQAQTLATVALGTRAETAPPLSPVLRGAASTDISSWHPPPVPVTAGETLQLVLSDGGVSGTATTFRLSANDSGGSDLCFKLYLSP